MQRVARADSSKRRNESGLANARPQATRGRSRRRISQRACYLPGSLVPTLRRSPCVLEIGHLALPSVGPGQVLADVISSDATRYGGGGDGDGDGDGDDDGDGDGDDGDGDGLALIVRSGFARPPPYPARRLPHRRPSAERPHSELAGGAPRKSGHSKHP
jgi:hypothetical protein